MNEHNNVSRSLRVLSAYLVNPDYISSPKFRDRFNLYWNQFIVQFKPNRLNCLVLADIMYYLIGVFKNHLNPDPEKDMWIYQRVTEVLGLVNMCRNHKLSILGMKTELEMYLMTNMLREKGRE